MDRTVILAVEPAIESGSLSLSRDGREIDRRIFDGGVSRSADLLPAIRQVIEDNNLLPGEIDLLAISKDRGSLTGLRVGTALLRGLSSALNIKIAAFDLLEIIAKETKEKTKEKTDEKKGCLIGIPVGRNSAEWLWTDGLQTVLTATGRNRFELEAFLEKYMRGKPLTIRVHESLFELLRSNSFADRCGIQSLGCNMARFLGDAAAKDGNNL